MTEVTAWVAFDDADLDNGCMSMVPGSNHWGNNIDFLHTLKNFGDMPANFEGRDLKVQVCPVKKGEVHSTMRSPGTAPAPTPAAAHAAIALHYMSDETRYIASGNHPMKAFVEVADGEKLQGKGLSDGLSDG